MLKRILISNRGEIALRIIRACKELGIESVAIYSEVDSQALHVKAASYAHCIEGDPLDAYLNFDQIIQVAKKFDCDAIHPGYGFISENADFARACEVSGLIFIGPSSAIIELMGSKIAARNSMQAAGLPIIPGSDAIDSIDAAIALAKDFGFPVMLKAILGGGGRGIRACHTIADIQQQYPMARSEAKKAFGDDALYLEKIIPQARHIEIQIVGDLHGNIIHLFERDCSIQRRHQKLIEVTPSPSLRETTRQQLYAYAITGAKYVGYSNVGTMEFMVDNDENIYFLEMNPRLQVEHAITEQITGIDLVQLQLKIASGEKLHLTQQQVQKNGMAIEFRINTEDPANNFLPNFGCVTNYLPAGGPDVRTESALYSGYHIPDNYDSLCAKLIVWARDWEALLARSSRALAEMQVEGVKTTIPFYVEILRSEAIRQGVFNTNFLEHYLASLHNTVPIFAAAIAAYAKG